MVQKGFVLRIFDFFSEQTVLVCDCSFRNLNNDFFTYTTINHGQMNQGKKVKMNFDEKSFLEKKGEKTQHDVLFLFQCCFFEVFDISSTLE